MTNALGLIVAHDNKIPPITNKRSTMALPISGSYRLIDFMISCMSNSHITNIGVVTDCNYTSLMKHIKSGKPWDLDRKNQGLSILPPDLAEFDYSKIRGNLNMLYGTKDFLKNCNQTYVILSFGSCLCNINLENVLNEHIKNQSDITLVYKDLKGYPESELSRYNLIETDNLGRVIDCESNPQYPKSSKVCLDIFVMEKLLLESIIDECSARGDHDFIKDALCKKLSGIIVKGYEFNGYVDKIDSIKSYFTNNMIFLEDELKDELFSKQNPIFTKNKDMSPTIYANSANVKNSIIANGCKIFGTVSNSVLSKGVIVKNGANVKNSIIMQDCIIEENSELEYVIFDKEVTVSKGKKLIGQKSYPLAIKTGVTI